MCVYPHLLIKIIKRMKEENIDLLLRRFLVKLREMGYSEESALRRIYRMRRSIRVYMRENGLEVFNRTIGNEYLESIHETMSLTLFSVHNRDVRALTDFLEKDGFFSTSYKQNELFLEQDELGSVVESFLDEQRRLNKAKFTVENFKRILMYFIDSLKVKGKDSIGQVTLEDATDFIGNAQLGKSGHVNTIRVFFRYLNETAIFPNCFCDFIPSCRVDHGSSRLPSAYTQEEVRIVEKSVDRTSNIGTRNYAMLLLATRLGLRASDIARIEFSNIDWDKNLVRINQYKTKRLVELPLIKDVGEAIIEYLRLRPISISKRIFLSERPPFPEMSSQMVGSNIADILKRSTVDIKAKRHGPHTMRHSLASNLLKKGTSLPIISEILGHSSTRSTRYYLRIDYDSLLTCAIPVPEVPQSFYEQEGGVFYD